MCTQILSSIANAFLTSSLQAWSLKNSGNWCSTATKACSQALVLHRPCFQYVFSPHFKHRLVKVQQGVHTQTCVAHAPCSTAGAIATTMASSGACAWQHMPTHCVYIYLYMYIYIYIYIYICIYTCILIYLMQVKTKRQIYIYICLHIYIYNIYIYIYVHTYIHIHIIYIYA